MGFSLGGAISGALGGFLVGGPTGAVVGGAAGGFAGGDREKAKVEFAKVPETEQAQAARAELFGLAAGELPDIPRREIAKAAPPTERRELARGEITRTLEEDFFEAPDVQAIIAETVEQGNLLTNRIQRALRATGAITATPGRDILGRTVGKIQQSIVAALSPFAERARGRRLEAAKLLEGLELSDAERDRILRQAELDARFEELSKERMLPFTLRAPLLEAITGLQPAVQPIVTGGGATDPLGGFGGIIGPLLSSILRGGGEEKLPIPKPTQTGIPSVFGGGQFA